MLAFTYLFFNTSCKNNGSDVDKTSKDIISKSIPHFSELHIDSISIVSALSKIIISDSIEKSVFVFYRKQNYCYKWFDNKGAKYAYAFFFQKLNNYKSDFLDSSLILPELNSLQLLFQNNRFSFLSDVNNVQQLELLLTATFFKYASKVYKGANLDVSDLSWNIPRKSKDYITLLDSFILLSENKRFNEPLSEYYYRLLSVLRQYRIIERANGFPLINGSVINMEIGSSDSCLLSLKKYLYMCGDLYTNDITLVYNDSLEIGIQRFQSRMGLTQSGTVTPLTFAQLNVSVSLRINQLLVNLERLRWLPPKIGKDYILINIPEFKLHVFENNNVLWNCNIVVGKSLTPTAVFKSDIYKIIVNPYWGVPQSIADKEILPALKRNSNYLSAHNMEVWKGSEIINPLDINWSNYKKHIPFFIKQKPGNNNALGRLKFMFVNSFDIYLHDTPSKNSFNDNIRAFSHGCIRISEPKKLLFHLLKNDSLWNIESINELFLREKEITITLKSSTPIYIVYFTTWVSNNGKINFRNDIYDLDKKVTTELFINDDLKREK